MDGTIHAKLSHIQSALNVPKNQENKFGGYSYRNTEDILAALKPLLKDTGCCVVMTDDVQIIDGRMFMSCTARIMDENAASIYTQALVLHPTSRKGMDDSQVSGSASSYARKTALCGLFAISGQDDADSMDNTEQGEKPAPKPKAKKVQEPTDNLGEFRAAFSAVLHQKLATSDEVMGWISDTYGADPRDMKPEQVADAVAMLNLAAAAGAWPPPEPEPDAPEPEYSPEPIDF